MPRNSILATQLAAIIALSLLAGKVPAQADLQTVLVAGVNQSTVAPSTSEVVYESTVTHDEAFLALMVAEASAGAGPGQLIPAPLETQVRTWRSGDQFRVEIDAIEEDGALTPNSTFVCDGRAGVRYTWAVPESLRPGIAEILSPERVARLVTSRAWEDFFQPKRRLELGDAESDGYTLQLDEADAGAMLGFTTYGLSLEKDGETITMHVAPHCAFLPLNTTVHDAQGRLVNESEVLRVGNFGGKTLPAEWVSRRYQGDKVVTTTEIKVVKGAFNQPLDDALFQLDIPDGFHVKQVGR